jgi:hypothetical protein
VRLIDIVNRTSQRLNEGTSPVFYPKAEIIAAANEGQRFFCLLTLGLEQTNLWALSSSSPYGHLLSVFSDMIAVLRITDSSGNKIRPASLADLNSLDANWTSTLAQPTRYVVLGADLIAFYPQATVNVSVTYARAPVALAVDSDVPEIPAEYHQHLVNYAIYRCRIVEGGQELEKTMKYFNMFLDGAAHYARYVRARNEGTNYDKVPFELDAFDRSKVIALRPELMPATELPQGKGTALPEAA